MDSDIQAKGDADNILRGVASEIALEHAKNLPRFKSWTKRGQKYLVFSDHSFESKYRDQPEIWEVHFSSPPVSEAAGGTIEQIRIWVNVNKKVVLDTEEGIVELEG